jgi:hypothetical protein
MASVSQLSVSDMSWGLMTYPVTLLSIDWYGGMTRQFESEAWTYIRLAFGNTKMWQTYGWQPGTDSITDISRQEEQASSIASSVLLPHYISKAEVQSHVPLLMFPR